MTTAVTNAIELVGNPGTTVIMTGGVIRPTTFGASGQLAAATLRGLHVDQTFLAIHSVSVEGGLTYPLLEEVDAKRAMIEAAARSSCWRTTRSSAARPSSGWRRSPPSIGSSRPRHRSGEAAAIRDLGIDLIVAEPDRASSGRRRARA